MLVLLSHLDILPVLDQLYGLDLSEVLNIVSKSVEIVFNLIVLDPHHRSVEIEIRGFHIVQSEVLSKDELVK